MKGVLSYRASVSLFLTQVCKWVPDRMQTCFFHLIGMCAPDQNAPQGVEKVHCEQPISQGGVQVSFGQPIAEFGTP